MMLRKREFVTTRRWADAPFSAWGGSLVGMGCSPAQPNALECSESSLLGGNGRGSLAGFLDLGLSSKASPFRDVVAFSVTADSPPTLNWHQGKSDLALAAWGKQAHGEWGGLLQG